jgi:hypothetical protein
VQCALQNIPVDGLLWLLPAHQPSVFRSNFPRGEPIAMYDG